MEPLAFNSVGSVQKSPSSKATAIFARGAYWSYVSTGKWRERRWRLFSTDPLSIVAYLRTLWCFLLLLTLLVLTSCHSSRPMLPINTLIPLAWEGYQQRFINADGRVFRPFNQDDTVSEGQAYALLMAVALDDRQTFDRVLNWTTTHLSRSQKFGDHLLAWHWEVDKGVTDWNSASDAEVDMALALLFAQAQWNHEEYRKQALRLLQDILTLETEVIGKARYLMPGNWRLGTKIRPLNPSYFSPAHFRLFYSVTNDGRWLELLESSYAFLEQLSSQEAISIRAGLVPDWIGIDVEGRLHVLKDFSTQTTWDAVRMPWRVALDVLWSHEDCGRDYLRTLEEFWMEEWELRAGQFFLEYQLSGAPMKTEEHVSAYAMALPALESIQSPLSSDVLQKVQAFFREDEQSFQNSQDYYQNSLSLLGLLSLQPSTDSSLPSIVSKLQTFSVETPDVCPSQVGSH